VNIAQYANHIQLSDNYGCLLVNVLFKVSYENNEMIIIDDTNLEFISSLFRLHSIINQKHGRTRNMYQHTVNNTL